MNKDGHTGLNAVLFIPVGTHLLDAGRIVLLAIGIVVVVGCSSLPDIDRRLPIKHRGLTHSVWFAGAVGLVLAGGLWYAGVPARDPATILWGFTFGSLTVLGHLLGDMLTPWGIEPIAPLSDASVSLDLVSAGSPTANRGVFVVGTGLLLVALALDGLGIGRVVRPLSTLP